jgi:hypothetical protein
MHALYKEIGDKGLHVVEITTTDEPGRDYRPYYETAREARCEVFINPVQYRDMIFPRHKEIDVYVPRYYDKVIEREVIVERPKFRNRAKEWILSFMFDPIEYEGPHPCSDHSSAASPQSSSPPSASPPPSPEPSKTSLLKRIIGAVASSALAPPAISSPMT